MLFLDHANLFGCAETTLMTLESGLGLEGGPGPSAVMALNGGVAYSGEICGALTGAAVAAGLMASAVEPDHAAAKQRARAAAARMIEEFRQEFGAVRCRDLVGCDLSSREAHEAFISGGQWKTVCMRQIEFTVSRFPAIAGGQPQAPAAGSEDRP